MPDLADDDVALLSPALHLRVYALVVERDQHGGQARTRGNGAYCEGGVLGPHPCGQSACLIGSIYYPLVALSYSEEPVIYYPLDGLGDVLDHLLHRQVLQVAKGV